MNRKWLKDWPWESVLAINVALCKQKKALHKPTAEGYEPTQKLWDESRSLKISLRTALQVCRQCHKLSPFCFYNGNTFAAIGRTIIQDMLRDLSPTKAHAIRSVVGHYIAGTTGEKELEQSLRELAE
jgi:hypothetical protein